MKILHGRRLLLTLAGIFFLTFGILAQKKDSTRLEKHFSGAIQLTHNGISLVPTFSLGKPAIIFLISAGGKRVSFEPDIRFSLSGKPWSMLFWLRYRPQTTGNFFLTMGIHPALNFRTQTVTINGETNEHIVTRRFLAAEIAPSVKLGPYLQAGVYYLYSRGLDPGVPQNNHFLTLNANIHSVPPPGKLLVRLTPQVYYLKQDQRDGFFFTSGFSLARKGFPIFIAAIINKKLSGDITGAKDFIWNTSLVYSFQHTYKRGR
ncbi:MAG: hypothetical protein SFU20_03535 [Chitinophagaceae bacterium]|nr:hypothetical protein [Chitinophagaceae bacterium]